MWPSVAGANRQMTHCAHSRQATTQSATLGLHPFANTGKLPYGPLHQAVISNFAVSSTNAYNILEIITQKEYFKLKKKTNATASIRTFHFCPRLVLETWLFFRDPASI